MSHLERSEKLRLSLVLDYKQSEKYDKEIKTLIKNKPIVNKEDVLKLDIDWHNNDLVLKVFKCMEKKKQI